MSVPIGILAALQLAFALTWVIYVIYLPSLAAQAGVPKHAVAWILLMDQVIFIACDWMAGIYADRVARALGRIGPKLAVAALVSCAAFLLLPWIAPSGSSVAFIALTALWSATSSALRAPPLTLTGRHATKPERPWIAAVYMLGLGLAAAAAPYLGTRLRGIDPRIPFTISTAMVIIATFALVAAERRLRADRPVKPAPPSAPPDVLMLAMFAVAVALFAIGFQLHFSVNSSRQYLRFAEPGQLESLMPVFWIGFNLAMLPAALITRHYGGLVVMALGGMAATLLSASVPFAPSIETLVALQFAAGAAWGFVLMSAFTAALEVGTPGHEGRITGMLFSMLALAAFTRIAFVSAELPKAPSLAPLLPWLPAIAWAAAAALAVTLRGKLRRAG